jgi:hypothetical protein
LLLALGGLTTTVGEFVFGNDVARQPAMLGHRESLPLGPLAYVPAPLPASRRPYPGGMGPLRPRQARVFHELSKLPPELTCVPGAQI